MKSGPYLKLPGSPLADMNKDNPSYSAACANLVTCNRPISTTDANREGVTDATAMIRSRRHHVDSGARTDVVVCARRPALRLPLCQSCQRTEHLSADLDVSEVVVQEPHAPELPMRVGVVHLRYWRAAACHRTTASGDGAISQRRRQL